MAYKSKKARQVKNTIERLEKRFENLPPNTQKRFRALHEQTIAQAEKNLKQSKKLEKRRKRLQKKADAMGQELEELKKKVSGS